MKTPASLQRYLSLQLGLVIVLQFVIAALLIWQILLPRVRSDIGLRHQALARAIADEVTAHLEGGQRQLSVLADYVRIQGDQPPEYWFDILDSQCETGDFFEAVYLTDYKTETIGSIGLNPFRQNQREDLMGLDLSGRDFLDRAWESAMPVWSGTFLSTASSRWAVAVTVRFGYYAIVGEITLDHLSRMISDLPLASGLFTMILDRRGRVIADSQLRYSGQQFDLDTFPSEGNPTASSGQFDMGGRRLIGTVVPVDELGWKVLVAQSYGSAFGQIQFTILIIFFGLLIALAAGLLFMWMQAGKLTRLFRLYEHKAQQIAQGQYQLQWPPPKTREFADFADSLQQMAGKISVREQQIVASENYLRITLDSIGDAVIATGVDSRITRINPTAVQLTGWSAADAVGRPLSEVFNIINGHTRQVVTNPVEKVLESGQTVGLANHTVLIDKTGSEYQIADSAAPIRREDGDIVGVVLVFRDVSESYVHEQALRESEKRLRNLTANVPGVVFQSSVAGDGQQSVHFVSGKLREIFGLEPQAEDFAARFLAQLPENEKEYYTASIKKAVDTCRPWHYEGRFIKSSGERIWFSGNAVPEKHGERIFFYGVLMDITERKQWEQALQTSESRFRVLFNEAPVMYVISDNIQGEPVIREANDLYIERLGYSREEIIGAPVARFYSEDSKAAMGTGRQRVFQRALKGVFTTEERTFLTKDGQTVDTLMDARPERDGNGQIIGIRATYLDVTERKRVQQEAKQLESALRQAQKMEAVGTLAGGIAHDFNNILSAVIGYSELILMETDKQDRLYENVKHILAAGLRARDLVQQILAFSRQDERELKPLQMAPLVKEALKLLRSSLPVTIEIVQDIGVDLENVMADPTQIHQIVMNLCTNAAQAMEENGGQLTVGLSQVTLDRAEIGLYPGLHPGNYVKLSVQDTGHGIPEELQENIFNPYFTTKEKGKGTGLGLSVVHGIIKSYEGAIYVYSEPGRGSKFSVFIPAIKKRPMLTTSVKTALPTGNEHILLVDDEPALTEMGQMILTRLGYQVTTCNSGEKALAIFGESPAAIDLVISDMTMPKMTGAKLAAALMAIDPNLPIILCTGFSQQMTEEKAAQMGVKGFAMKPLAREDLALLVRKVLDENK